MSRQIIAETNSMPIDAVDKFINGIARVYREDIYWDTILLQTFVRGDFGWQLQNRNTEIQAGVLVRIKQALYVLAKLREGNPHFDGISLDNHFYDKNFRRHIKTDAPDASREYLHSSDDWSNVWCCNAFCAAALCEMSPEELRVFLDDLYRAVDSHLIQVPLIAAPSVFAMPYLLVPQGNPVVQINVPITDHPLIESDVNIGGVSHKLATINIWCPGTPLAPSVERVIGSNGKDLSDEIHMARLTKIAEYIVQVFQSGVELLALQEVPNPNNKSQIKYFNHLVAEINRFSVKDSVSIDVNSLISNFLQTGTHDKFGTSVLVNPQKFLISSTQSQSVICNRGAKYTITDQTTGKSFSVVNFHTEYNSNQQYVQIVKESQNGVICLGDTNSTGNISVVFGGSFSPTTKEHCAVYSIAGNVIRMNTTDAILLPSQLALLAAPAVKTGSAVAVSHSQFQLPQPVTVTWQDTSGLHSGIVHSVEALSATQYKISGRLSGQNGDAREITVDLSTNTATFVGVGRREQPVVEGMGKAMLDRARILIAAMYLQSNMTLLNSAAEGRILSILREFYDKAGGGKYAKRDIFEISEGFFSANKPANLEQVLGKMIEHAKTKDNPPSWKTIDNSTSAKVLTQLFGSCDNAERALLARQSNQNPAVTPQLNK